MFGFIILNLKSSSLDITLCQPNLRVVLPTHPMNLSSVFTVGVGYFVT